MAYTINFTDEPNNGSITVEDGTINTETSLKLVGKNATGYGSAIAENFLHLLENFASATEPSTPVEGQLWYDTGNNQLKVYDATEFVSSGGLIKASSEPDTTTAVNGDLWVDTNNQQLYLFAGSQWILVGPDFSEGLQTGAAPKTITGQDNVDYVVLQIDVNNEVIAIVSKDTFSPKATINGFTEIKPGVNLADRDFTGNGSNDVKFFGTAEKAENLLVANTAIPAANFLRGDVDSTTTKVLNVQNNQGVNYGLNAELNIGVEGQAGLIQHQVEGSNVDIRVKNNGESKTVIRVDSDLKVGINNVAPDEALDVTGNIQSSGKLFVNDTTQSTTISDGSAIIKGGVGVAKNLYVGDNVFVSNKMTLGNNTLVADLPESDLLMPDSNNTRNIGNASTKWRNVYATTFKGNLEGRVSGDVSGSAGSADKLTSATVFKVTGDVEDVTQRFDGQTKFDGDFAAGTKQFNLTIKNTIISAKTSTNTSESSDEILVNRTTGGDTGLKKITRGNLFNAIKGLTPVGSIMPYAGALAPAGWLICDGSEIIKTDYNDLFDVIGYTYGAELLVTAGKFKIPDLRGRLLAGLLGGATGDNRITSTTSDNISTLGAVDGNQQATIEVGNLPEHTHDLRDGDNNQFYAVREVNTGDTLPDGVQRSSFTVGDQDSQRLPSSGGVNSASLGEALDIINPFMAVNFIIYTGRGA